MSVNRQTIVMIACMTALGMCLYIWLEDLIVKFIRWCRRNKEDVYEDQCVMGICGVWCRPKKPKTDTRHNNQEEVEDEDTVGDLNGEEPIVIV